MGKYKKISTLKASLTKADKREREIRQHIVDKARSTENFAKGDFIRWSRQLKALRLRKVNLRARLSKALKEQAIELEKQKTLIDAEPTIRTSPTPQDISVHRMAVDVPKIARPTG